MTIYFVLGGVLVAWALVLTALGLTRENFPPERGTGRALMALSALLCVAVFVALLAVTETEHPREEAKAEAAEEEKAEREDVATEVQEPAVVGGKGEKAKANGEKAKGGKAKGGKKQAAAGGGAVAVREDEYSIQLPRTELAAGKIRFDVTNAGEIQHDLAVEGPGGKKTPLIDAGKKATLEVDLKPGRYELICTVPGHEQLGMKTQITVK